ncbi:hypothetical protein CYMTET_29395 [Cymbomonas tetramitiformis]|uniref:Uncharacterized protein n=1 Tax=Cymbomonas tetramitiformis TaxID=36881 RepID=A0AAE0KV73_9CHLO|nr:hypothetical protein CYMTET_29395 [Cymbomonas tetramitiformis]
MTSVTAAQHIAVMMAAIETYNVMIWQLAKSATARDAVSDLAELVTWDLLTRHAQSMIKAPKHVVEGADFYSFDLLVNCMSR